MNWKNERQLGEQMRNIGKSKWQCVSAGEKIKPGTYRWKRKNKLGLNNRPRWSSKIWLDKWTPWVDIQFHVLRWLINFQTLQKPGCAQHSSDFHFMLANSYILWKACICNWTSCITEATFTVLFLLKILLTGYLIKQSKKAHIMSDHSSLPFLFTKGLRHYCASLRSSRILLPRILLKYLWSHIVCRWCSLHTNMSVVFGSQNMTALTMTPGGC